MTKMSDPFQPNLKMSLSEEMFSSFSVRNKNVKTSHLESDPGTSYEVFRNNTTAVEVIVKEVPKARKKTALPSEYQDDTLIRRLQNDIVRLRTDLNIAKNTLAKSRKGFLEMVREMRKQLDAANQSEMETQTKNLALQLDNEKLKTMLLSKSNLLNKLKKELVSMKRVMRYVIKSICNTPPQVLENVTCSSEPDYDEFENNLKKNFKVKFASTLFDDMCTFDSSIEKDTKYSFDKRLL
ncbi:hypothetical protein PYW07_008111 [Mythimna separata]|uniref:Uncharacterized protein n=1 Tax=Mythimna separata TaxID=271217 RepID=A0AAD7YS51_MYTSE|nr:hypothetical protein PYW07_008111 [Mythimna separata]